MDYMIRFTQVHETFRLAEIKALAELENINLQILSYSPSVDLLPLNSKILMLTIFSLHFA
jgi:tRNA G10  N-methylase Trm11